MKNLLLILFSVLILLLAYYLFKCHKYCKTSSQEIASCNHIPVDLTRVIFWKKPNASIANFKNDLDGWFRNRDADQIEYCMNCDSSLVIVSGADVVAFLSGQTSNGSPPKNGGGLSGDDGFAYYCVDFPMEFKDSIVDSVTTIPILKGDVNIRGQGNRRLTGSIIDINQPAQHTNDTVTVAVFDTGVDPDIINSQLYKSDILSCLGLGSNNGWNFPAHNDAWQDDYEKRHGTVVSKMIIDQEFQSPDTYIKILPVKVHAKDGISHLSDILCALQYAKNRGAKVINASFGFYAPHITSGTDTASVGALLFKNFLQDYFKDNNILMIAAAGNMDNANENHVYYTPDIKARRNLDSVSFFPASFASSIPNVFAVTTVSEGSDAVSPRQNFSAHVVDIGVNADAVSGENYVFQHPYKTGELPIQGSSFATPVVTGKMAAHYQSIAALLPVPVTAADKDKVLDKLVAAGFLHVANSNTFSDKIRKKRIMNK